MAERWVVNASPLILLAKIDQLHLLSALAGQVIIPSAVADEVNAGPSDDPTRLALADSRFPLIAVAPDPMILAWNLGSGETAVLSFAVANAGWSAVLDDGAARRCARALDIPFLGTLAIILRARRAGPIPAAAPLLKALRNAGIRLDNRVIQKALSELCNEEWV